ncbi:MAG: hypothetical protein LBH34_00515 [Prevotellaceae bacterium]|jgi:hypothetical protein|nr:hypothetical protein [Prevotellaceae bacterium]
MRKLERFFRKLARLIKEYQVGIYVTVIFHLLAAIALVSFKLHTVIYERQLEITFDFSEQEAEKIELLELEKRQLERQVNQMLAQVRSELRNVAVNEELEDNNRSDVLQENEELQRRIEATREMMRRADELDDAIAVNREKKDEPLYTGPSVMSYRLEGRNAYNLPVPVYKCEGGGDVAVNIMVTQRGTVILADIDAEKSTPDECLWTTAKQAALSSKFNMSRSEKNQKGVITYRFVSQYK